MWNAQRAFSPGCATNGSSVSITVRVTPLPLSFFNSKGTGNAKEIDKEAKKFNEKKVFKNAKGLDSAAKDNEKIKHTKNYTEKETKREYNEDVAKPQFKTNKEKEENFTELNKDEDVSNIK